MASISDQTIDTVCPQIAVDSSGNALAAWFTYDLAGAAYSNVIPQPPIYPSDSPGRLPRIFSLMIQIKLLETKIQQI